MKTMTTHSCGAATAVQLPSRMPARAQAAGSGALFGATAPKWAQLEQDMKAFIDALPPNLRERLKGSAARLTADDLWAVPVAAQPPPASSPPPA